MTEKRKQQANAILAFLEGHAGEWVSVFDLIYVSRSLSHTRRISDLKDRGFDIKNRIVDGKSEYKLVPKAEQLKLIA